MNNFPLTTQWQIQDFPEEERQPLRGTTNYDLAIFLSKLRENKEIRAVRRDAPPAPSPRSANAFERTGTTDCNIYWQFRIWLRKRLQNELTLQITRLDSRDN